MAALSQPFPPWLTPIPTVVTDSAGVITTSTTVLYLPLTYYGPSIPLNSDWTYGGLTSPASTATSTTSASTLVTTTSATPTSSTTTSSTATPSSTSSTSTSVSLSSSFTSTSTSSTASSTSTSATTSHQLSRGQLIGVIVASILGAIFLFILALSLYLFCKGRKKRRRDVTFSMVTPIDEDYMVVGEEGRTLGEGSPRHSGEEADPFLQRSQGDAPAAEGAEETGALADPSARVPPPTGSLSSNGSSSTNHSGYGVLIDRPTLNLLPSTTEEIGRMRRGHILSPEELHRINEETVLPSDNGHGHGHGHGRDAPLPPPPRLPGAEPSQSTTLHRPPFKPQTSHLSQMSTIPDDDEPVTVIHARRVRVEDLASRTPPQLPFSLGNASSSSHSGFLAGLGAGLASIGRLSWLKSSESNSRRTSRTHSYLGTPNDDVEAGKSLLHPQMSESTSSRGQSLGKNVDGTRPVSTSSVSGASVYHDAYSSLPGTPLSPLPRALTPSSLVTPERGGWPSKSSMSTSQPTSFDPSATLNSTPSTSATHHGLDILDMPVPSAVLPLTSASTSTLSLKEKNTTSSLALKSHAFPPGLAIAVPKKSWTDASSGTTQVYAPFAAMADSKNRPVSIDVLEEAPPSAEEGWRSMAAVIQDGPGRRTTFGGYAPIIDIASEQGSLYSMQSHISPTSLRSSGSAPASRRDQSYSTGSASSRPSVFSAARASAHSVAASRSISSAEQKRAHAVSPTLSAFGPVHEESGPSVPPTVHFNDGTVRSIASGSTAVDTLANGDLVTMTATEPPGTPPPSPLSQIFNVPWAAGLDQEWNPTDI